MCFFFIPAKKIKKWFENVPNSTFNFSNYEDSMLINHFDVYSLQRTFLIQKIVHQSVDPVIVYLLYEIIVLNKINIKMNNKDIQERFQNIISTDKMVTKQIAMKTKHFYKKLHFLGKLFKTIE